MHGNNAHVVIEAPVHVSADQPQSVQQEIMHFQQQQAMAFSVRSGTNAFSAWMLVA